MSSLGVIGISVSCSVEATGLFKHFYLRDQPYKWQKIHYFTTSYCWIQILQAKVAENNFVNLPTL